MVIANAQWRGRSGWRRPVSDAERYVPGLCFGQTPGVLVAVVGLTGGAGASVLAYLIAATAARESNGAPVLLADTSGPTSTLASLAGVTARLTLCDIAQRIAAGETVPVPLWTDGDDGLRIIAGVPQFTVDASRETLTRILKDAREAHCLTVVDAGTLARQADQAALASATHVAWAVTANEQAVMAAGRMLERVAPFSRPELIVARSDPAGTKPPFRALTQLAESRRAPLVLIPTFGNITGISVDEMAERSQVGLQAIGGVLQR